MSEKINSRESQEISNSKNKCSAAVLQCCSAPTLSPCPRPNFSWCFAYPALASNAASRMVRDHKHGQHHLYLVQIMLSHCTDDESTQRKEKESDAVGGGVGRKLGLVRLSVSPTATTRDTKASGGNGVRRVDWSWGLDVGRRTSRGAAGLHGWRGGCCSFLLAQQ